MKWFALLGMILFLGVAIAPSINAENTITIVTEDNQDQIHNGKISREKMIEIAEAYVSFEWYPAIDNIAPRTYVYFLLHSIIHRVIQNHMVLSLFAGLIGIKYVDTPDRNTYTDWPESVGWKADEPNIGVPYQWGGFSSISGFNLTNPEDFKEQYTGTGDFIGKIHYTGDIFCDTQIASIRACGVDCSGFVSRCWNLSTKQSTRTLDNSEFSIPITFDELQMGDILCHPDYHVMLFHEFVNENMTSIRVYEAGPNYKVGARNYDVITISEDRHVIELNCTGIYGLYSYNAGNWI